MKNSLTLILLATTLSLSGHPTTGMVPFTGNDLRDRTIVYPSIGAISGAIIGNQIGDGRKRSENRAIGAGVGALGGLVLANKINRCEVEAREATQKAELERLRRSEKEAKRRDILLGRKTSDEQLLRKQHRVIELENEVARIRQEHEKAAERTRLDRELDSRMLELEQELGKLKGNGG